MIKSNIQYNELNFNNDYDSTLLLCCNKHIINFLNTLPIKEDINKLEFYQNNNITLEFHFINNVLKLIDKVECQICFNKNNLYQFYNCNHGICFFCFKNHNTYKCPFCRNKLS